MLKLKRRKEVEGAYGGRPLRSKSAIDVRSAVVFVDFWSKMMLEVGMRLFLDKG